MRQPAKKRIFLSVFLGLLAINVNANNKNEVEIEKQCSFLIERTSKEHCIEEQKDEILIKQYNDKPFEYIADYMPIIASQIKTMTGLQYFSNKLEIEFLNPNTIYKDKEQQMKELEKLKKYENHLKIKFNKLEKIYENNLNKWAEYQGEGNEKTNEYATNRIKLLKAFKGQIKKFDKWGSSFDYFIENKIVNKELVLPLYLGEKINVKKEHCEMIKTNVPHLVKNKKNQIKGCEGVI